MLTDLVREWTRGVLLPIARLISWSGVSPNVITVAGFSLTVADAILLAMGHVQLAGALLIPAAGLDAIDGSLARIQNRVTRFGAFLDSTIDRLSEAVLFLGALLYYLSGSPNQTEIIVLFVALIGSLMVSYTKARSEAVGITIRGGLLTRFERMLVLIIGMMLNELTIALWILAVFANITVLQRVWLTWRNTRDIRTR
ncbi:MAG: CDP-alcohol phosphatidyltransferase family protein [Anaerolineae bacterium]